ncbi:hypothetical protein Taro_029044 [Colocasia esculenta]|uniref:Uncharacterized protein n=1 Tax=Colocasia esculenta TaxID=4460 RepID=A0A843VMV1_COLES|nr:hypothetical protein [Colocasia esculenta]
MHLNLEGNTVATNQTIETSNPRGNTAEDFNEHRSSPREREPSLGQQQNNSGNHHQNTSSQEMHLNPEGNAATTGNEHNIVLGKPHLHQNQQRRTLGAPH